MAEILTKEAEIWSGLLGIDAPQDLLLIFQVAVEKVVENEAERGRTCRGGGEGYEWNFFGSQF